MRINHNIPALNTYRQLNSVTQAQSRSMEKLSSGLRINRAADDAAGLSISEKMKAQIRGLNQADRNILDGVSMVQVADGGLAEIHEMLQRMRELSVQAANGTLTDGDRINIQREIDHLKMGINDIVDQTTYNNIHLLNGAKPSTYTIGSGGSSYRYENVLYMPPVDDHGLFQFRTKEGYPTTELDNNETLVYSQGQTSYPSVRIGGKSYVLHGSSTNVSIAESMTETNGVYNIKYTVRDADIDVDITQSVNIVKDKYQIKYRIQNNSQTDKEMGFLFNIDTMLGSDDHAPFIIDGMNINSETVYKEDEIPHSFIVYNDNGTNPDLQAHGILRNTDDFPIIEEPDQFGVGQWTLVDKWEWVPNSTFGDSAYSIRWDERMVGAGEAFEVNTYYGLSVPPTVEDPVDINDEGPYDIILQVGSDAGDTFLVQLSDVRTEKLGIDDLDVSNLLGSTEAITMLDQAIKQVSTERSKWGAYQNALGHIERNVTNRAENTNAAQSRVADADMAKEMAEYTTRNIIMQSAQAMLAQSNQLPQGILQLLK